MSNTNTLLERRPIPSWLREIDHGRLPDPLPIDQVLAGSVYYPACGRDGDPVRYLGGAFTSFIYVDYGLTCAQVRESLRDPHHGFDGYAVIAQRMVCEHELAPHGWTPIPPLPGDGNMGRVPGNWIKTPFALWTVLERQADYGEDHGPERFSLLYVGGDGAATFQALYHSNGAHPEVVAVIQPGHAFGGNWTNFTNPDAIFARSVLQNRHGIPRYLLYGGWGPADHYRASCWPSHRRLEHEFNLRVHGGLCLFSRSPERSPLCRQDHHEAPG